MSDELVRNIVARYRVAARYRDAIAAENNRQKAQRLTTPINKPKGLDKGVIKENGLSNSDYLDEAVEPARRDIRPRDVFNLTPDNGGVLSLAQSGKDLSKALDKQVPKDKGHDAVSNLSQYLISTDGGGSAKPQGK